MATKEELRAASNVLRAGLRLTIPPPTADELEKYFAGQLSDEGEERVREQLVLYPDLATGVGRDEPKPGEPGYVTDEQIEASLRAIRARIAKERPLGTYKPKNEAAETFAEIEVVIPEEAWLPIGPDEDRRSILGVALLINGARHYLEAYAIHERGCTVEGHESEAMHGALGDDRYTDGPGTSYDPARRRARPRFRGPGHHHRRAALRDVRGAGGRMSGVVPMMSETLKPGQRISLVGEVQVCGGCEDLRVKEIPCLACDLPCTFTTDHTFTCTCFDWPDGLSDFCRAMIPQENSGDGASWRECGEPQPCVVHPNSAADAQNACAETHRLTVADIFAAAQKGVEIAIAELRRERDVAREHCRLRGETIREQDARLAAKERECAALRGRVDGQIDSMLELFAELRRERAKTSAERKRADAAEAKYEATESDYAVACTRLDDLKADYGAAEGRIAEAVTKLNALLTELRSGCGHGILKRPECGHCDRVLHLERTLAALAAPAQAATERDGAECRRYGCPDHGPFAVRQYATDAPTTAVQPPSTDVCLNCGAWLGGKHKAGCGSDADQIPVCLAPFRHAVTAERMRADAAELEVAQALKMKRDAEAGEAHWHGEKDAAEARSKSWEIACGEEVRCRMAAEGRITEAANRLGVWRSRTADEATANACDSILAVLTAPTPPAATAPSAKGGTQP